MRIGTCAWPGVGGKACEAPACPPAWHVRTGTAPGSWMQPTKYFSTQVGMVSYRKTIPQSRHKVLAMMHPGLVVFCNWRRGPWMCLIGTRHCDGMTGRL